MARNTGDRTCVRNMNISSANIGNTQAHNEREKKSYINPDIVPERAALNVHFKAPTNDYTKLFAQMEAEKIISTRGLKPNATKFCELVFDVNSAYFYNHGGYEFAREFYEEAYRAAVKIVGGEQYILSAVMHADERNRAMSEKLGEDVYHYHLHVVYVPVVEKQILWMRIKRRPLVSYRKYDKDLILFEHLNAPTVKPISDNSLSDNESKNNTQKSHVEKLASASEEMKKLYYSICDYIESLGDDIVQNQLKLYLAYKKVQNMVCVEIYNKQIILYLKINPESITLEKGFTRDMRSTGHYGTGDLQVSIKNAADFEKAKPLLNRAYNEA